MLQNACATEKARDMSLTQDSIAQYRNNGSIRRYVGSLLFVDISGFTILSQNYPVEDFRKFINGYFEMIIDRVNSFGGDVIKFAGDALYALWPSDKEDNSEGICEREDFTQEHGINIARAISCGIAITTDCNNYKISKSYSNKNRRRTSMESLQSESSESGDALYSIDDKGAEYECRDAVLNVYCGVGEGTMAGVDVIASNRAEFFLIGQPLA
eukprot:8977766-Ditylum_brightwellii.AAC.1